MPGSQLGRLGTRTFIKGRIRLPVRKNRHRGVGCRAIATLLCLLSSFPLRGTSGQTEPIRRVLILNEVGVSYPLINLVDEGIRTALHNSGYRIEFYREYLDTVLFPDAADQQRFRDFYILKYQNRKPDVIITVGPTPLQFMAEAHSRYFPGVPVVFCLPALIPEHLVLDSNFTGVEGGDAGFASTIGAALRLKPDTRRVVIVGGQAPFDRQQQATARNQLSSYRDRIEISYLTELDASTLLQHLKELPGHTIVLMTALGRDAAGTTFTSAETGPMVVHAANAPVFSSSDRFLNHGEVGGDISSGLEQGQITGGMALRLLRGEKPRNVPVVKSANRYTFDWRALRRWGMKETDLPPDSIVLNRQPSIWEAYTWNIVAGLCLFIAQTSLIVGLLWQRRRRRKAELELGMSEEKFSKAFRQSPLAVTIVRASDGRYIDVNETFEAQTGWKREEAIGRSSLDLNLWIDPAQRTAFMKQLSATGNVRDLEVRVRRKDGQVRTALGSAELIEVHGEHCALSVMADITERKQAEEAISSFSRRLIEAQEAERTRIARELHDDINQQLAMVAVSLKTAMEGIPDSDAKTSHLLDEAGARVSDLESDIQALSHRLHSSKLDFLGIEGAASSFCRELSERQNVKVDFRCESIPEGLSSEVSLCLYRVLQEALHNALKYSGVDKFDVSLTGVSNAIELRVHDSGAGFDVKRTGSGHGLGLTSMKERLKLVDGECSIYSEPNQGTTILARVPTTEATTTTDAAA
jgi:PAS domain S-box-containing protein